jgi:site-specific recombinase XerD
MIGVIEEEGGTKVRAHNTHILRHTCASLYFRAGVPIEMICAILGNTREVCEKTYIHFVEEQLKDAAAKMVPVIEL